MTRNILFISYHFYPSNSVGAKRPSETVKALVNSSYNVTVLRAVSSEDANSIITIGGELDSVKYVSVKVRRKAPTALGKFVKSIQKKLYSGYHAKPVDNKGPDDNNGAIDDNKGAIQVKTYVRNLIDSVVTFARSFESFLQYQKRWLSESLVRMSFRVLSKRPDIVITSGPPFVGHICGLWVSLLSKAPLVLDYRDPWYLYNELERTELDQSGRSSVLGRIEDYLAKRCAHHCSAAVVASDGIGQHLISSTNIQAEKVVVIRNGFDGDAISVPIVNNGTLVILYCGSLYWKRDPFPFLLALKEFLSNTNVDRSLVKVKFVGNCERWNSIDVRLWVHENALDDVVSILPEVDSSVVKDMIINSHLLLNLAQGQKRQIPAKSYEYIASGRPSLVITESDSDVAKLFEEAETGTIVEPDDIVAMIEVLRRRYSEVVLNDMVQTEHGNNATMFSREYQTQKFIDVVDRTYTSKR